MSWKGTLVQYTGRLHRLHPGKTGVRIFDYVDRDVPVLVRMFEKRRRGYRTIGYSEGEPTSSYDRNAGSASSAPLPHASTSHSRATYTSTSTTVRLVETSTNWSEIDLEEMVKEATVDCYGEAEQATGLFMMIQDSLELPFETVIDGSTITVQRLDLGPHEEILAVCTRNGQRSTMAISDIPLASPSPLGAEWIAAYCYWLGGG